MSSAAFSRSPFFGVATAGQFEDGQTALGRKDYTVAMRLLRPLAEQGDAAAQFALGAMYFSGLGVPQDYAQAAAWFGKAADRGHPDAQSDLGAQYEKGQGVPQNYTLAHMWFNLAAASATDATLREIRVKNRDEVAAKMTPAQIAEAQRMASEWAPK